MPNDLASEMAIYEANEQEHLEKQAKCIADFLASQPGPRNVPSGSRGGFGNRKGATAGNGDDNSTERSRFSKQWKGIKFQHDEVQELLMQEPACDQCMRLQTPCTTVDAKLTCLECQTRKIQCPRKFNNTVRALAQKLGESEEEVRSMHSRFMKPSTQNVKGDDDGGVTQARAKTGEAHGKGGMAKGKGKKKEKPLKIVIPGGRGRKSNETRSECSEFQAACEDEELANDGDEMDVDVPVSQLPVEFAGVSASQSQQSGSQGPRNDKPTANQEISSKIAVDWFLHFFRAISQVENNSTPTRTDVPSLDICPQLPAEDLVEAEAGSEPSDSRTSLHNDEAASKDELEMDVDVPRMSTISNECGSSQAPTDAPPISTRGSHSQGPDSSSNQKFLEIPPSKTAIDIPEPSPSQPHHHSHPDDTQSTKENDNSLEMHVNTPTLQSMSKPSRFHSPTPPDLPLNLKWDYLS
ncbi:hypothetical protein M413DRAFT_32280 [Hebeloma cylindrosporum]|uniref:Zn(2)-C6 fungal-type domain-containing protein n=1 Tax=Hebeloma cylindrosporum TaxID=76867 RepID=A0A0C3BWE9_HEBCY|nr:hypothetical protein M413DRAFT_32280 [Hebeloma cylindrosporum h7]